MALIGRRKRPAIADQCPTMGPPFIDYTSISYRHPNLYRQLHVGICGRFSAHHSRAFFAFRKIRPYCSSSSSAMVPAGVSDLQTAVNGITTVINGIERIIQWRAEKRRRTQFREQGQLSFLRQFTFALAPDEDAQEEETIRSYCKKLQTVIRTHLAFISGGGQRSVQAAHATMATFLFHFGALPFSTPTQNAKPVIKRQLLFVFGLIFRECCPSFGQCGSTTIGSCSSARDLSGAPTYWYQYDIRGCGAGYSNGFRDGREYASCDSSSQTYCR